MTVAVVVPCRNEAARIAGLLGALTRQTRQPDEIILVDDRSTDDTVGQVRRWVADVHARGGAVAAVPVRVLTGEGRGPGPAMNAGIRATTADIIMRMDGHAVPEMDYLARSLQALEGSAGQRDGASVGVVGGVWRVEPGAPTSVARAIAAVVSHPAGSGGAAYRADLGGGPPRDVETVPFGTFPRRVWERLGGFDESLEANQDFDFNYRVRRAGLRVVLDPSITSTYFARPTLTALWRQYFRYGYWKRQMLRKDGRAVHPRQLPPALLVPWLIGTVAWVAVAPSAGAIVALSLYPVALIAAAAHAAASRRVSWTWSIAALGTVHLAWGAGFWSGMRRPPR